ncbi:hypothetical protein ONE63_003143 [Megalurothrips usitatus]|uniref:Uncharacterized protein n=1 Tax=Megalurothrips usitatus TaxID=439358 RepID=A0AAV7XDD7_9NEOP|nr:hypothetical protein ONE63_003143 [Megalurothrips usitatus]
MTTALVLLAVACLLPPPRGEAAPAPAPGPAPKANGVVILPNAKRQQPAMASAARTRISVGDHYTMRSRKKSVPGGAVAPAALRDPDAAVDGVPEPPRDGERIIRVPYRRQATGCRLYQSPDASGRCRQRW